MHDDETGVSTTLTPQQLAEVWGDEPYDPDDPIYQQPGYSGPLETQADRDDRADWHVRKLLALREAADAEDRQLKAAIDRLRERRKDRARAHDRARAWHLEQLHHWHRQSRPGVKSVHLPSGVYWTRSGSWSIEAPTEEWEGELRAALAAEGHEAEVFEPQPDAFRSNALRALVEPVGALGEPGSRVPLRFKESGALVVGVSGTVRPGQRGVK